MVTGEAFLFLASATTLSLKVCAIHMFLFCHNLQCHYYVYSNKKKWFKHHYYVIIYIIWGHIHSRYILFLINKILYIKFIYWTLRVQMIAHLTRLLTQACRCSLKLRLFSELYQYGLEMSFFTTVHKINQQVTRLFFIYKEKN